MQRLRDAEDMQVLGAYRGKAGDTIVLEAKMDLIIGLTACSALQSNNGSFKPIHYRID